MKYWRYVMALMVFFTTVTNYMLRFNMSQSLISMVRPKGSSPKIPYCLKITNKNVTARPKSSTSVNLYEWNETDQGKIMGSYFIGYLISSSPAGIIASYLGATNIILYSSLIGAILNAFTPLAADCSVWLVIGIRGTMGFLGGLGYPAVNVLIARWAPPKEKGKFLAAMMGNTIGIVLSWNVIAQATFHINWHWGFYCVSLIIFAFCGALFMVGTDSPTTHKYITDEEKEYILAEQAGQVSTKKAVPPYWKILTSFPVWVIHLTQWGNLWGLYALMSYGPKFMSEYLGFNIKASASLAALPYIFRLIFASLFGVVGDLIRKRNYLTVAKTRKYFTVLSHICPGICLLLIILCGCNIEAVITLLVFTQIFNGAVVMTHLQNIQDLSPNFAGTVYGIMSTLGGGTGYLAPWIHGIILDEYPQKMTGPHIIFAVAGAHYLLSGIWFILFASAEVQPWNEIKEEEAK